MFLLKNTIYWRDSVYKIKILINNSLISNSKSNELRLIILVEMANFMYSKLIVKTLKLK